MLKLRIIIDGGESPLALTSVLGRRGFDVAGVAGVAGLIEEIEKRPPDLVVVTLPGADARERLDAVRRIRRRNPGLPIVLIARDSSEELAVAALRAGASDYFRHSTPANELIAGVERCLADARVASPPAADANGSSGPGRLIGESPLMRDVRAHLAKVAAADSNVLITGETGTGKELVAELIHTRSSRRERPFVSINCAAIPESLLESELFGYERGAFTGAHGLKEGKLRGAAGGSAFFDEIGDMTLYAQAKILRAIENKEVQRLGGNRSVPLDVRVIAATNQDLERLVDERKFRRDLYFRIDVARIHLPPLRDRKEDIPRLLQHSIGVLNERMGRHVEGFTDEALALLLRYDWPGNIRELKNVVEAIFVNLPPRQISLLDLPETFRQRLRLTDDVPDDERERLMSALFASNWNKSQAAQRLHWSRMTVYRKLAKYRLVQGGEESSGGAGAGCSEG